MSNAALEMAVGLLPRVYAQHVRMVGSLSQTPRDQLTCFDCDVNVFLLLSLLDQTLAEQKSNYKESWYESLRRGKVSYREKAYSNIFRLNSRYSMAPRSCSQA